ncbi:hypothetical protein E1B28_011018 [Marasmius oreades]|uniref:Uncharacterized protein n=1 Tax=Marasmius oreades TaxID=181124 RepID=A0A9P7RT58_9AGAR|nr:uncharacterized protein E1B28_011018 [Marasmius oreades]KAG7089321.1 hypothetical protein E1B28_011018 [Marasmius oreades]
MFFEIVLALGLELLHINGEIINRSRVRLGICKFPRVTFGYPSANAVNRSGSIRKVRG